MERVDPGPESLYKDMDQIILGMGARWRREFTLTLIDRLHQSGAYRTGALMNSIQASVNGGGGSYVAVGVALLRGLFRDWGVHRGLPVRNGDQYTARRTHSVFHGRLRGSSWQESQSADYLAGYFAVVAQKIIARRLHQLTEEGLKSLS